MRAVSILLLLACACVCVIADTTAATPAAAAAAPVAAAPVAATPTVDLSALTDRVATVSATLGDLKDASVATATQVQTLASIVEAGLTKLNAADVAQTTSGTTVASRLDAVEREVAEIKRLVTGLAATAAAAPAKATANNNDALLAEIKASQAVILERLANATATFDFEAILGQAKVAAFKYSADLSKFVQRTFTSIQTNYPQLIAKATELATQYGGLGFDSASDLSEVAIELSGEAHRTLIEVLQTKAGVPLEFVVYASFSILALIAIVALLIVRAILKALCSLLCCCFRSKKESATKSEKKAAKKAAQQ